MQQLSCDVVCVLCSIELHWGLSAAASGVYNLIAVILAGLAESSVWCCTSSAYYYYIGALGPICTFNHMILQIIYRPYVAAATKLHCSQIYKCQ